MKITKEELKQIIREEAIKFKKALELKKELASVQKQLDEVYAGDDLSSEKQGGVHAGQKKAVFKKKGDAVVEDKVNEDGSVCEECMDEEEVVTEEDVVTEEEIAAEEEDVVAENLDEPIEGESVAQKVPHANIEDGHEKDTHVKEGEEKTGNPILTEEQKRMRELAGLL